jgi:hypothetical protein
VRGLARRIPNAAPILASRRDIPANITVRYELNPIAGRKNPTAERRREAFRVGFDRSVKLEFDRAHATGGAGLLAGRELDDGLRLTRLAEELLVNTRTG